MAEYSVDLVPVYDSAAVVALTSEARAVAVTGMLTQARSWLANAYEAYEPVTIANFKAEVATLAEATKQLGLSREIQAEAQEIVIRAERGLGQAIRKGQAEGTVRTQEQGRPGSGVELTTSGGLFTNSYERRDAYALAEAPDDVFEEVLAEAKTKGDLSRSGVVRTIRQESRQTETENRRQAAANTAADLPSVADLRVGDFREVLADLPDGTVDAIITDPPYPAEYLPLFSDLSAHAARLLRPGGICAVMVGQSYLPELYTRLTEHLAYYWTIAYLTPGGQSAQVWPMKVNTFWKPVILLGVGPYDGAWYGDVAKSAVNDNDKDHHHWGQSESGMTDLIERLTLPGHLILDPFLGAGTTGVVAVKAGRRFIGCDLDPQHVATAETRTRTAA